MTNSADNKIMVVTGATSGIGQAIAAGLAREGISVIGTGRNATRCQQLESELRSQGGKAAFLAADLSLLSEVRRLAIELRKKIDEWGGELKALFNNAATVPFKRTITAEGLDMQWAVNHLAPFLLTHELLPVLKAVPRARVINVSSGAHYRARPNWEDVHGRGAYFLLNTYARTKLANVLFTAELNRRLGASTSIRAFAAEPGLVNTEIGMKSNSMLAYWFWNMWRMHGLTPEESAKGIIFLATEPSIQNSSEIYWKHGHARRPSRYALELKPARELWELSAKICKLQDA